jgi:RNA polymerase sigma-70 factor (ECF subfamily)
MKIRKQRRKPEEDIERYLPRFLEDGHHAETIMPWCESAETILQRAEMCSVVRHAIEQLPETHRVVLLLRDIEEMSTEETATVLGTTCNAVKIRLHRARQALRTLLDPYMRAGVQ